MTPVEPAAPPAAATAVRWRVALWLALAAAIAYLSRTSIAVAEKSIREALRLSESQMGLVMGPAFFWTYALAQIPTAWLGQRYGSRRMLVLFMVSGAFAVLLFGLAGSLVVLLVARMAMGISQAGLFPCATQTFARWHPPTERARASGLLAAAMQAGHGLGLALTGLLIGLTGWRFTFCLYSIPGVIWAAGFGAWFRNDPREHRSVNAAERQLIGCPTADPIEAMHARPPATPWRRLLLNPAMQLICAQQFFRAAGQVFFASWFATYLQETRGVTLQQSAWMTALPVIATMLASLIGGGLSDRILLLTGSLNAARKGVATATLLVCAAIVSAAGFVDDPLLAVLLISAGVFSAGFAGPCAYAVTIDVGGRHVPAVFSTMNMLGNFGAGLLPWIVPRYRQAVLRLLSDGSGAERASWDAVLLLFAAMYLAAALCWWRVRLEPSGLDV